MSSQIPIVDLAKLVEVENVKESPEWVSIASEIREGLGTVGFLYLVNHGIPQQVISNVFLQSQKFFALKEQTKLKYKKNLSSFENKTGTSKAFEFKKYVGYGPQGGERLHPDATLELKETFDWVIGVGDYPNVELPQFEPSIARLDIECKKFLKKFLRLLAMSLEIPDVDFFVKACRHFDDAKQYNGMYNMRLLHYPPTKQNEDGVETMKAAGAVRLGEHSDYGFITLLFQDDTGGLEVKHVDGQWLEAKPIPGSIVVNTGDLTEFWTCGIFPATPHRVAIPEIKDVKRSKSRYSVVFFNGPDTDVIVTPMEIRKSSKEEERLAKTGKVYKKEPINASDYMMGRVADQYNAK